MSLIEVFTRPNSIFWQKTNFRKINLILVCENWHSKLKIGVFDSPSLKDHRGKFSKIFEDVHFDAKRYWISPILLWKPFQNCYHAIVLGILQCICPQKLESNFGKTWMDSEIQTWKLNQFYRYKFTIKSGIK